MYERPLIVNYRRGHRHRRAMSDLHGLDRPLLRASEARLPPLRLAQLNALRSGAFLFDAEHSRFDLSKSGICVTCQVPDTRQHRVCQCPRYAAAREGFDWVCRYGMRCLPASPTTSCPPSTPHVAKLQAHLAALPGLSACLLISQPGALQPASNMSSRTALAVMAKFLNWHWQHGAWCALTLARPSAAGPCQERCRPRKGQSSSAPSAP